MLAMRNHSSSKVFWKKKILEQDRKLSHVFILVRVDFFWLSGESSFSFHQSEKLTFIHNFWYKVECVFATVVVIILPHAEFGPNGHRYDGLHFKKPLWNSPIRMSLKVKDFNIFVTSLEIQISEIKSRINLLATNAT